MPEVLFGSGAGDEVINVRIGKGNTAEDLIHETLKRLSSIPKAKRHSYIFK